MMPLGGRLPNFLIIGAMKAGTSSLYSYLLSHPQVFMPDLKEVNFFTFERRWKRGWEWYARCFSGATEKHLAVGEASTSYSKYPHMPDVPARVATRMPNVRLVYVVRDPIARIRSDYTHRVGLGVERRPIERAVVEDPSYVNLSRYALQIDQYMEHFSRDQLLVITSESLRDRRSETLKQVFRFLEVDDSWQAASMGVEFNRSDQRLNYPRPVLSVQRMLFRRAPRLMVALAKNTPKKVKLLIGTETTRADEPTAMKLPAHLRDSLSSALRDDLWRLREYMGRDFDGWGLLNQTPGSLRTSIPNQSKGT